MDTLDPLAQLVRLEQAQVAGEVTDEVKLAVISALLRDASPEMLSTVRLLVVIEQPPEPPLPRIDLNLSAFSDAVTNWAEAAQRAVEVFVVTTSESVEAIRRLQQAMPPPGNMLPAKGMLIPEQWTEMRSDLNLVVPVSRKTWPEPKRRRQKGKHRG